MSKILVVAALIVGGAAVLFGLMFTVAYLAYSFALLGVEGY